MTLLWADSFNTYNDSDFNVDEMIIKRYEYENMTSDWESGGRYEDGNIKTDYDFVDFVFRPPEKASNLTIVGLAVYIPDDFDTRYARDWSIIELSDGEDANLRLLLVYHNILLQNGDGDIIGIANAPLKPLEWFYVELKSVCHETEGTAEVRINGCPAIKLTDIKTQFGTNNTINRVYIGDREDARHYRGLKIDDFYICDGEGSKNNDFLGPYTSVCCLFPDGEDSVNFAITGNANYATHYEQVNKTNPLWDTDYIEDDTTGNEAIFTMDNTVNYEEIHGLVGWSMAEGNEATANYKQVVISGNTESKSDTLTATLNTIEVNKYILEDDPDTSNAWTLSSINDIKFGIEVQ